MMRGTRVYGIIGEIFMRGELTAMLELRLYVPVESHTSHLVLALITGPPCSDKELCKEELKNSSNRTRSSLLCIILIRVTLSLIYRRGLVWCWLCVLKHVCRMHVQ